MQDGKSNITRYPYNIFSPVKILDDSYILYPAKFKGLKDLYTFLKSNPEINSAVFKDPHSQRVSESDSFYGVSYEESLERLIHDDPQNYRLFTELNKEYAGAGKVVTHRYKTVNTLAGGHIDPVLYSKGSPLCYETQEVIVAPRYITAHVGISTSYKTTDAQIYNKAISVINIVYALQKYGYKMKLDSYVRVKCKNEIIQIIIDLKERNGRLNINDLYEATCNKEFYRRIIFRVIESMSVEDTRWPTIYGSEFSGSIVKNDKDLYFASPMEMGLTGEDLYEDFRRVLAYMHLEDYIDVPRVEKDFKEKSTKLKLQL